MTGSDLFSSGIYPILDAGWLQRHLHEETWPASERVRLVRDMEIAGIRLVQLRCKDSRLRCRGFFERWIDLMRGEMEQVRIVLNDHLDLVTELGADGVHVGQEDMTVAECRAVLGSDHLIGLSTHNRLEIVDSLAMAVDYVGFGPLFKTDSKPDARAPCGLEGLAAAVVESGKPVVAIGGIQPEHLAAIAASGARAAAMISGLWGTGGRFMVGHCIREFARGKDVEP
ncbi:MAG: thiamine phosphate synthase [Magnetococcales bacterium]|nr:thiamine phosphate synthase [Magnetococcales bacterium]MBF0151326.1 thiamine phosphate synthase [Magnetococcales bacterium]MBF0174232.1 thiamine phosphate synthase [Magnetococcales bacterium]MBF0347263.1 thiamine phosphate synthase [Magnetococcales bacterium]MBF0632229.1 thiamine phosphate synthase [Magnetococcales bacterium]